MRRVWPAVAAVAGLALGGLLSPARAEEPPALPKNPNVQIEYVAPTSPEFRPIYERLKTFHALESLQIFLAPLQLPKPIKIRAAQCGALEVAYRPGQPVTICYEFVRQIELAAPELNQFKIGTMPSTKVGMIIGGFIGLALDQTAYAVIDVLDVPVWGRMDDAADNLAALVMLEFPKDVNIIWNSIAGTSWFMAQAGFTGSRSFTNVRSGAGAQRFVNYICAAYAVYPTPMKFLVANGDLPKGRADLCANDYRKFHRSFMQTIMPHVDEKMLADMRKLDWQKVMHLKD